MNPISSAAWDSLEKDSLPKLLEILRETSHNRADALTGDDLQNLAAEVSDLLRILRQDSLSRVPADSTTRAQSSQTETSSGADMSDEEALALLAEMDGDTDTESQSSAAVASDMSDEEAMMLLAEMEGDAAEPSEAIGSDTLSAEDEALAMLAGMEEEEADGLDEVIPTVEATPKIEYDEVPEYQANEFSSDPEMLEDFVVNSADLKESLDQLILKLESNPADKEIIEEIFRAAHTLKGVSGMMGFKGIENLMHWMEHYFDLLRKGKKNADSHAIYVLFQAIDILETLMDAASSGTTSGVKLLPIITKLQSLEHGSSAAVEPVVKEESEGEKAHDGDQAAKPKPQEKEATTIRVDLARLDSLVNLVGELVIDRTRFASIEEELRVAAGDLPLVSHMTETVQLFGRHMNDIQETIMKIRMVPIGNAFSRYNRVVRDLARTMEKEIDLYIDGEETELDKTLVEMIGDPLVHLIRNACDHGIESPEIRQLAGKKPRGLIHLSARQEGNNIVMMIEDDGKGLDMDSIKAKAIDRGLIDSETNLSNRELFSLIFEPGFSTAKEVTNISGRGVGMDVVKKQISALKGLIDIDSSKGKGTKITIQLPLTLAIVQSLLVRTGREIFAVPLSSVIESLRISPKEIQRVGDNEVINRRDMVLPLVYLDQILHLDQKEDEFWYDRRDSAAETVLYEQRQSRKEERVFVVVVGSADRRFGIVVDSLLHQQEVVIKSMGPLMHSTRSISGGAILGDGEVVLVLDMAELESMVRSKARPLAA